MIGDISPHLIRFVKAKKFSLFVAKGAFFLLICFVAGEVTLRVYHYFNPIYIFFSDSYNRFRGKPYADDWNFKLNSKGFKDVDFTIPKPKNTYRILALGDSFAFGVVPYQFNYLTLLETELSDKNFNVEVLNMGIPSTGPRDYLSILVREGLEYSPDMVLLSFFTGNDYSDSRKPKPRFSDYAYVFSLLRYLITIHPKYSGAIIHGKREYCDACASFDEDTFLKIEKERSLIYQRGKREFSELLKDTIFYLTEIRNVCRNRTIKFVIVIIPDELQVNPALQSEIKKRFYADSVTDALDFQLPNRALASELKSLGIPYLDLLPYFSTGSIQRFYRLRDTHWNIAGNKQAASVIGAYVKQLLNEQSRVGNHH